MAFRINILIKKKFYLGNFGKIDHLKFQLNLSNFKDKKKPLDSLEERKSRLKYDFL